MKRSDLTPGQSYLLSSSTDWPRYGGSRVEVLTADRWIVRPRDRFYFGATRTKHSVTGPDGASYVVTSGWPADAAGPANGVPVRYLNADGTPKDLPAEVVPLLQIRDTWEAGTERVQRFAAARAAQQAAETKRAKSERDRFQALLERARTVLGDDTVGHGYSTRIVHRGEAVSIPMDLLDRLLERAQGAQ